MIELSKEATYRCNFHIHSNRSDGKEDRDKLIQKIIKENSDVTMIISITDHNLPFEDISVLQEKYKDIVLLSGTEVSTSYVIPGTGKKLEVHVIALDYDIDNVEFLNMLKKNQHDKKAYIGQILQKLEAKGIHAADNYEELASFAYPSTHVGRMTIARLMVKKHLVTTVDEAFDLYFGNYGDRTCYVENPFEYVSLSEAITTIKKAHGLSILCHPLSYNLNNDELDELVAYFKALGGHAMECEYLRYNPEQRKQLKQLAHEYRLNESCGTDYHGNLGESLGENFPIHIYEDLMRIER